MNEFRTRRSFGKDKRKHIETSNLIGVQKNSYAAFLQADVAPENRICIGLQAVFMEAFHADNGTSKNDVEFLWYELEKPKHTEIECVKKDLTYGASLKVRLKVTRYAGKGATRVAKDSKEQTIYFSELPLMTNNGCFIVNGTYRVIVSQLHKSAGVFFDAEKMKGQIGKKVVSAHVVPYRGAWLDFEIDQKGVAYVRIDKKRKLLLTTFLMLLNLEGDEGDISSFTKKDILNTFYNIVSLKNTKLGWKMNFVDTLCYRTVLLFDVYDVNGAQIYKTGDKLTERKLRELNNSGSYVLMQNDSLIGLYIAEANAGIELGEEITSDNLDRVAALDEIFVLELDNVRIGSYIRDTMMTDKNNTLEDAVVSFYRIIRPGEAVTFESAVNLFRNMFFNFDRFDLSTVGRMKLNSRLKKWYVGEHDENSRVLTKADFIAIIRGLVAVRDGKDAVDDIDHLALRRVRSAGELVANQCRVAMFKLVKTLRERLNLIEAEEEIDLHDIVNTKILSSSLREFFGTSQLSQIVDNINALSEVSHKRRVTAMGQGGLNGTHVTFEVRDVHSSHYGRICAVETPEGQNIGLINYLAMHARIDEFGFIQTPYRKVVNGVLQEEVVYLNAFEEEAFSIATYCVTLDASGAITDEAVSCRKGGELISIPPSEVDYIDVSNCQILSVASSLIPFIENVDPGRALMGANMQRQALPLKVADSPICGTGFEDQIAKDSMTVVIAEHDGIVVQMDSSKILVRRGGDSEKIDTYVLHKFGRTNSSSCVNQRPIVSVGQKIKAGQVIADGSSTDKGEIAVGRNLRVAYMSFKGCTFEDSIVISDKLLNDSLTSVKIEEFDVTVREGEEITSSIPGVSDEFLCNLDETGVVYLGAKVRPGDVLVGKVAPKVAGPVSPEERLLKAMFGEKADSVVDASLRVLPGCGGTVIDVQIFSARGVEKDERTLLNERVEIQRLTKQRDIEVANVVVNYKKIVDEILIDEIVTEGDDEFAPKQKLTADDLKDVEIDALFRVKIADKSKIKKLADMKSELAMVKSELNEKLDRAIKDMRVGDVLPTGVNKIVKVFVAINRTIEPGDKLAGRHGNKGVISRVLPVEDMPFDDNGEPVDIIINPLGIAARMNVGQIFETHLGWVSKEIGKQVSRLLGNLCNKNAKMCELLSLMQKVYPNEKDELAAMSDEQLIDAAVAISSGVKFAVPSFDSVRINEIKNLLIEWGLDESGKIKLRDGVTGEYFDAPVTVGYLYVLKLNHMVSDKVHARSTGSYSLVTQQPPGGRAKMGGQRQGEMETWALEAYGAAYITRESMTVKSDAHASRIAVYEAITQGHDIVSDAHYTPEAFRILQSEMKCIGINLECVSKCVDENGRESWEAVTGGEFQALKISLLSPELIVRGSFGEVKKSETINYRTQKAEIEGLHCPVIFGPEKDYKCSCGRYNKMKYRGIVCEKCGVEVTVARVRRERVGHIELATPVAHIWFAKILPSRIGMMTDLSSKDLDRVLRFERYIVSKPGITLLKRGQLLSETEYMVARQEFGAESFTAMMGAEGIEAFLKTINLEEERARLLRELDMKPQEMRRKKLIKKLKLISGFIDTKTRPEWMILRMLPVMPADLRPLVALDAGRFATSDVNELYRKVINRNNRLKELLAYDLPDIIIRNEKRMLQNAVDALIDNSRLDKPFSASNRVLQSIGDALKGKYGRFRQNLLGKRVDYSGRSVIIVGPHLKLHQCGLPKKMALELFKPFVFARLEQYGYAATLRSARRIVEEQRPEVWEILKEVCYQQVVILNRAPTLHRLSMQAFEIVLVDHNSIELHPLVCAAYNADFDGDQMSVHVPLSVEAQIEARVLMMPTNNMISPANGKPVVTPKKDMVLGLYYLTHVRKGLLGEGLCFNQEEVELALRDKVVDLNAEIKCLVNCKHEGMKIFNTSPGRVLLYNIFPDSHNVPFAKVNRLIAAKDTIELFNDVYRTAIREDCVKFADDFMNLGFDFATSSSASCSYTDFVIPSVKKEVVQKTWGQVNELQRQYNDGLITEAERKNNIIEVWHKCDEVLGKELEKLLSAEVLGRSLNPLYMMYSSGARGSLNQIKQILSMRGFVAKTGGQLLENAVCDSYAEGLNPHSYYSATHGTRKGLSDTALKTAEAGYFTRKLVDVAQDCIVTSENCDNDCKVNEFSYSIGLKSRCITIDAVILDGAFDFSQAFGRVLAEDVLNPADGAILLKKDDMLLHEEIAKLQVSEVLFVKVRSPITCKNSFGVCAKCYGVDLSKSRLVSVGESVGIVAAQSIGEPGAQLTMHTFHTGGGAKYTKSESCINAACEGVVTFRGAKFVSRADGVNIMISKYAEMKIIDEFGRDRALQRVPYGSAVFVKEGQRVKLGDMICEWDQYIIPKLASVSGYAHYVDLLDGISLRQIEDESTGTTTRIVCDWKKGRKNNLVPAIVIKDEHGKEIMSEDGKPVVYLLEIEDVILIESGQKVSIGDMIVKKQKRTITSGDITSGLPKLVEIFEARLPKLQATISEVDGVVTSLKDYRAKKSVIITSENGIAKEYIVQKDQNILVQVGDVVRAGDQLCDGDVSAHDILRVLGFEKVISHLLKAIQAIFNSQGIVVDNKHVECILRYMLRKVEIIHAGESNFVIGEQIEYTDYISHLEKNPTNLPVAMPVLLGISRAASSDPSFIKAASFQEAQKVFVSASVVGAVDDLNSMKSRLITGHLIPAGTGFVMTDWKRRFDAGEFSMLDNSEPTE